TNPFPIKYIDCASPSGTFTHPGHPLPVPTAFNSPLCGGGSGVVMHAAGIASADFIVSENYPNPYTGKTSVDVTLSHAADVSIEISNVIGQTLLTLNYKNLHAGKNVLSVDGSS